MIAAVAEALRGEARVAVAVSGGVDSLTLATIAGRWHADAEMFHAVSPAVPAEATARVAALAEVEGWRLRRVDAGELSRPEYVANPADRCYFCKSALYGAIAAIEGRTSAVVVSGTNVDDLGDYRPGLRAAAERGVRHPFVEVGARKADVRAMARELGLGAIADLPAGPCLASRVETGIAIDAAQLARIEAAERLLRERLGPRATIRCRVLASGPAIALDGATLAGLDAPARAALSSAVGAVFGGPPVPLTAYVRGSTFLVGSP